MRHHRKLYGSLALTAAAAIGALTLSGQPAEARRPIPGPLCGPDILWNCDLPFGPDIQIGATVCEIRAFEARTGATCDPA